MADGNNSGRGWINIRSIVNGSARVWATTYYNNGDTDPINIGVELVFVVLPGEKYYFAGNWGSAGINGSSVLTTVAHYWLEL